MSVRLLLSDVDGTLVTRDKTLTSRTIEAVGMLRDAIRDGDSLVQDLDGAHVEREAATVEFQPTVVPSFDGIADGVVKILGVSDDHAAVAAAAAAARDHFGDHVSAARSQPYYVDVTHPDGVTTSNDEDGFANAVERFILRERRG